MDKKIDFSTKDIKNMPLEQFIEFARQVIKPTRKIRPPRIVGGFPRRPSDVHG